MLVILLWNETNFWICRGENGELRVGVRRAMRQQGNVPSSVISSHSMHLGVLATAWHAILTGTIFTVYYKPRFVNYSYNYVETDIMVVLVWTSYPLYARLWTEGMLTVSL